MPTKLSTLALLSSIVLPAMPASVFAETYSFTGSPSSTSLSYTPTIPNGTSTNIVAYASRWIYSLYSFTVTETGDYDIVATTADTSAPLSTLHNTSYILNGTFSPTDTGVPSTPISQFIISNYDHGNVSTFTNLTLTSGNTYSILTAYSQTTAGTYPYTVIIAFDGPGCVAINGHICIDLAPPPQSGSINTNTAPGTINVARDFGQSISTHLGQMRNGSAGTTSADDIDPLSYFPRAASDGLLAIDAATPSEAQAEALGLWGNTFGNFVSNRGNGASPGFNQSAGGVIVGADTEALENLWLGIALGYAHSNTAGDGNSGSATADNYHASLYASWTPGPWFATAELGLTLSDFKTERPAVAATAAGASSMLDTSLGGEIGYAFDLDGLSLASSASLRYDQINSKGYTETGAGLANLTIEDATHHALRIGVGATASKLFTLDDDLDLEVNANVRWEHDLLDTGYQTTQSINGASYQVSATDPGRDAAVLGLGATALFKDNLKLSFNYDAELRARQTNHSITAGLRFTW